MDGEIKGVPGVFSFKSGANEITVYGIVPDGWVLKNESDLIVLSKDSHEVNLTLLTSLDKADTADSSNSKVWYLTLLKDFLPNDYNYTNISLSAFTIEGLDNVSSYSAVAVDEEGKEFLREDLVILNEETPLRVKMIGENTEEMKSLLENLILSFRFEPYN